MQISYKWLGCYVDLKGITPRQIAEKLTASAYEVEEVKELGAGLEKVVVGEVLRQTKHPDADKLSLLEVKISESEEALSIVCGAPNVAAGQKVAVALVGATLPGGLAIAERTVRGAKSCGMVCAEDELGLGKNHEGILVLDDDLKVGTPLSEALGLDDTIFSIDILPNRAHDSLCHYGVAREVAALFDLKLKPFPSVAAKKNESSGELQVEVKNLERCPRYAAALLTGVQVKESPAAIQQLLRAVGLRPINNLVDITNFVMFTLGSPLHAFDADKLQGEIVVRLAEAGETLVALDGENYELTREDLVICDARGPIAIAGVMGGLETAVSKNTRRVIFEAANFAPAGIRKTAQRLKLASDSSYRFERGLDPNLAGPALQAAIHFTQEWAGAGSEMKMVDHYPAPLSVRRVSFKVSRIERLLGLEISRRDIKNSLEKLDFGVAFNADELQVEIPTLRLDVEQVNDVIEEIARVVGYEKISSRPALVEMRRHTQNSAWSGVRKARGALVGLGFTETYNASFVSAAEHRDFSLQALPIKLKNYLSEEEKFFRVSLVPKLLNNISENAKYFSEVDLFEIGKVAEVFEEGKILETRRLGMIIYARGAAEKFAEGKGRLENFLALMDIRHPEFVVAHAAKLPVFWHSGRTAEVKANGKTLGWAGEIKPHLLEQYTIPGRVFCADLDFATLLSVMQKTESYNPINRFPSGEFDLAVLFKRDVTWGEIKKLIWDLKNPHIISVTPFDIYEGEELGEDKKSVAFKVVCQAPDRTLGESEIKRAMQEIIAALEKAGGEIRQDSK